MELARLEGRPFDSCLLVLVEGEIDASNASEVTDRINGMVESGASGLIVDLSGTEYLDSAGIRMLFNVHARLDSLGQGMVIAIPQDAPARQVLALAEVPQVIPVADSAEGAVGLIDGSASSEGA
jgi:anti-anti-sigma factor